MVAEVASGGSGGKTPKVGTPGGDVASVVEGSGSDHTAAEDGNGSTGESSTAHTAEGSNAQTLVASTSTIPAKGKGKDDDKGKGKEEEKEADSSNLVGKINNLMSTVRIFPPDGALAVSDFRRVAGLGLRR
jgi:hypothetical protein